MMRRVPLKPKRDKPRRRPSRIVQERMKPKAGAKPTATEKRHIERIAKMPCIFPGCGNPANIHHETSDGFKHVGRHHRIIVPLCKYHHQDGPQARHKIAPEAFFDLVGFNLYNWAADMWLMSAAMNATEFINE